MVTLTNVPNPISNRAIFTFETSAISATPSIDFIEVSFLVNQPDTSKHINFRLDGVVYIIHFSNNPDGITSARPYDAAESIADYTAYFTQFLEENPKFVRYKILEDNGVIKIFNGKKMRYETGVFQNYAFTHSIMTFKVSTEPIDLRLNLFFFDKNHNVFASFENNFYKNKITDEYGIGQSIIEKPIPSLINFAPQLLSERLGKYYIKFYESNDEPLSTLSSTSDYYLLNSKEDSFIDLNYPFLLQKDENRIIGEHDYDWLLVCFPNQATVYVQLFEYDKNEQLTTTVLSQTAVDAYSIIAFSSGTKQLDLAASTVRYSVQIGYSADTSIVGCYYTIDSNNYPSDYQILFENERGGFSMLKAKGESTLSVSKKSKRFLAQTTTDTIESSLMTEENTFITYNTGFTDDYEKALEFQALLGAEIYVIENDFFVKRIVETSSLTFNKENNLHSVEIKTQVA